jgi:hypothetical protein
MPILSRVCYKYKKMSRLFDMTLVRSETVARSLSMLLSLCPIVAISTAGSVWPVRKKDQKNTTVGIPPPWVFICTWLSIGLICIWTGIVASFHVTSLFHLYGICLGFVLFATLCVFWLKYYHLKDKQTSISLLAAVLFLATVLQTTILTADVNYSPASIAMSIPPSLLTFWSVFALILHCRLE